jgi:plasmid stabilization system protein ParE
MTRVVWTFKAIRNLNAIRTYIGQFSPLAAQRMALRLLISGEGLVDFPERGMPISDGRRQLTTTPPYLLRYRVEGEVVTILEVRHAAEDAA